MLVKLPTGTQPDGIAFGAKGSIFEDYFFVNDEGKTVYKVALNGKAYTQIAAMGSKGDFVTVDPQGNLLLTQKTVITQLSSAAGGQWVLPGSTLCSSLRCGAMALTTPQIDNENQSCLSGFDANLLITAVQAACSGCSGCSDLNQARTTLNDLINSLDGPLRCLDGLKATAEAVYASCPCGPSCSLCPKCAVATKLLWGLDFDLDDSAIRSFARRRR